MVELPAVGWTSRMDSAANGPPLFGIPANARPRGSAALLLVGASVASLLGLASLSLTRAG